jgi:hypothetical protein
MTTPIEQFRLVAQPPAWALKEIRGGRLRGMTDIKPAWRIQAMTEAYGLCGVGWKYEVVKQWTEPGPDSQVFAFVDILLYVLNKEGDWSDPIPGTGGSMLVEKEKGGLHANDEAFKMATTDALSSAMKMIGMGHDVYAGQWDGSKYRGQTEPPPQPVSDKDIADLMAAINEVDLNTLENTILRGKTYQRLKTAGPADKYETVSKLAKARHAVLKGTDNATGSTQGTKSDETPDQGKGKG